MGGNDRVLKLVCGALLLAGAAAAGDRSAFPGAEGFGAMTPGGRGGHVLFATKRLL
jgi:hypothetical protein